MGLSSHFPPFLGSRAYSQLTRRTVPEPQRCERGIQPTLYWGHRRRGGHKVGDGNGRDQGPLVMVVFKGVSGTC